MLAIFWSMCIWKCLCTNFLGLNYKRKICILQVFPLLIFSKSLNDYSVWSNFLILNLFLMSLISYTILRLYVSRHPFFSCNLISHPHMRLLSHLLYLFWCLCFATNYIIYTSKYYLHHRNKKVKFRVL